MKRLPYVALTSVFLAMALPASSQKLTDIKHRLGSLLHLSALPTFIVYSNTSLTMGDTVKRVGKSVNRVEAVCGFLRTFAPSK